MTDDTVRDGLARALVDALGWDWGTEPWVPSPTEDMLDAADAALAYLAARPAVDAPTDSAGALDVRPDAPSRVDVEAVVDYIAHMDAALPHQRIKCSEVASYLRATLLPTAPIRHEPGCNPDPTEDPYHGCECGAVGGQPHGRFAPTDPATPDLIAQAVELALVTDVAVDALADALTYALAGDPDSAARRLTALVEMFHEEDE